MATAVPGGAGGECRACLGAAGPGRVALAGELARRYTACTALQVFEDDPYPKWLCAGCADRIASFYEFREQCHHSENILKSYTTDEVNLTPESETNFELKEEKLEPESDDNLNEHFQELPVHEGIQEECRKRRIILHVKKKAMENFIGTCDLCLKKFTYKAALITHLKKCGIPKHLRPTKENLYKKKIGYSDALFCGICKQESSTLSEVAQHLRSHQESNELVCKLCDYCAVDYADLFCHRFTHQPLPSPRLICYICSKSFHKAYRLEFHFRGKHMNKLPGLCKVCKHSFNNFKYFRQHQLTHTGVVFVCSVCSKSFNYEKTRDKHMLVHSEEKPFICHICGFSCRAASGLKSHNYRHHTKHETELCNHCGKKFKNGQTLREHILRVNGEKLFPCSSCDKQYRTNKELLKHAKWHSDEKPHTCDICGNSYKVLSHLKTHMRCHTGERPFVCEDCGAGFMTTNTLKIHTRIHSGEKPYCCADCGKGFAAKNNMIKHMETHSGSKYKWKKKN